MMLENIPANCGPHLTDNYVFICWRHPGHLGPHITIASGPEDTFRVSIVSPAGQTIPLHPVYRDMISAAAINFDLYAHAD